MRLFGVAMVRNEADIVEASVRHNLSVLDGLVVIDHGSIDGTSEILASLHSEGLALQVATDRTPGFFQAERITIAAREILACEGADFVFPIDADEFIKIESRRRLEEALADVPHDAHALVRWLTYVPDFMDSENERIGPAHLRWRLKEERHGTRKSVIGRSFLRPTQHLVSGSHLVDDPTGDRPPPHVRLDPEAIALAHCPVRSAQQLQRKIIVGYLAHLATLPRNDQQAFHWRDLYEEYRAGRTVDAARLKQIASNYSLPRSRWQPADAIELVEDPVALEVESRYCTDGSLDMLRLLMRFTETLLARTE
jgi:glycosyl transferase family 2